MDKFSGITLAKPDDPIFKERSTFYIRPSDRVSTPSTKPSPTTTGSPTGRASKKKAASSSPE